MFPKNPFRITLLALVLLTMSQSPLWAQSAEDLARLEKEMAEQKAVAANLEKKEKATTEEIDDLRQKLVTATSGLSDKEDEQEELEDRLAALEKETALRSAVLGESRNRLGILTRALLQLSRRPPALFFLQEQNADEHIHRTILLRSFLPRLKEETTTIAKEIENFEALQNQTATQKRLVAAAQQNLQWQRHNLDQLVRVRQGLLQKTQAEKEAIARQLDSLSSEAKDLRQLMERVSNPSWGKNLGKDGARHAAGLKQGLKMPAGGKIIRDFGSRDDFGVSSEGITISGSPGSPVVAPQNGKVVFVGPFRGYGKIVILQHQGGYHSFLAGFGRIDAEMGQVVDAGEPLGVLPAKGEGKSELYFEWRKGSDPIDPTSEGLVKKVRR